MQIGGAHHSQTIHKSSIAACSMHCQSGSPNMSNGRTTCRSLFINVKRFTTNWCFADLCRVPLTWPANSIGSYSMLARTACETGFWTCGSILQVRHPTQLCTSAKRVLAQCMLPAFDCRSRTKPTPFLQKPLPKTRLSLATTFSTSHMEMK